MIDHNKLFFDTYGEWPESCPFCLSVGINYKKDKDGDIIETVECCKCGATAWADRWNRNKLIKKQGLLYIIKYYLLKLKV